MSFEEIVEDFKSLENLSATIETMRPSNENYIVEQEYKQFLQLQDYRRPKFQENCSGGKFRKLNRSYSLQEMRDNGLQVKPNRRLSQQKNSDHALILSEFIM